MEEEPTKADLPNGSFVRYVKPKKKASGRSAKRPAEDPGADPTDDAAAESARRQEGLERRANGLHDALCRTYVGLDQLLSLDYLAQWHPSATKLNADDQDEYVHNVCVKLGRFSRIESMDQGNPESEWNRKLKRLYDRSSNDLKQLRVVVREMSSTASEAPEIWSDKVKVHEHVHGERLKCRKGHKTVFECLSFSEAWEDTLMKKEPKRRKTESTSTGASSSRPKGHQQSEPVPMDDDCLPADDDNAPHKDGNARRSVAGTLGQRRFQRAPGPLSFEESQQLDQGVAADALDNVLGLLQRKTSEAYVVPWYRVSGHTDACTHVCAGS